MNRVTELGLEYFQGLDLGRKLEKDVASAAGRLLQIGRLRGENWPKFELNPNKF